MQFVVDASAVIALLRGEPGGDQVQQALAGAEGDRITAAQISSVNLAEVHQQLGPRLPALIGDSSAAIEVVDFSAEHAVAAAEMYEATRAHGLSLADRACLTLAQQRGLPALTADRAWAAVDVGVEVRLIR